MFVCLIFNFYFFWTQTKNEQMFWEIKSRQMWFTQKKKKELDKCGLGSIYRHTLENCINLTWISNAKKPIFSSIYIFTSLNRHNVVRWRIFTLKIVQRNSNFIQTIQQRKLQSHCSWLDVRFSPPNLTLTLSSYILKAKNTYCYTRDNGVKEEEKI